MRKEMKALVRLAEDAGWTVTPTRNGHWKWVSPQGATIIGASTPSDHRGWANHVARLRRAGLEVKH